MAWERHLWLPVPQHLHHFISLSTTPGCVLTRQVCSIYTVQLGRIGADIDACPISREQLCCQVQSSCGNESVVLACYAKNDVATFSPVWIGTVFTGGSSTCVASTGWACRQPGLVSNPNETASVWRHMEKVLRSLRIPESGSAGALDLPVCYPVRAA